MTSKKVNSVPQIQGKENVTKFVQKPTYLIYFHDPRLVSDKYVYSLNVLVQKMRMVRDITTKGQASSTKAS